MAFGEVLRQGFETLPHSSTRIDGNDTLRRTNRVRLHASHGTEAANSETHHNEGLVRKVIEKLGISKLMRVGSSRV